MYLHSYCAYVKYISACKEILRVYKMKNFIHSVMIGDFRFTDFL